MENGTVLKMIVSNSLAWLFFHLSISIGASRISTDFLEEKEHWFALASWERNGHFWQKWTWIRLWKDKVPDSTQLFKRNYDLTSFSMTDEESIKRFILETRRAELTHWLSIVPAPLFFIWNPPWAGWFMVGYAVVVNAPFILIQRYNRPRLEKIRLRAKRRNME